MNDRSRSKLRFLWTYLEELSIFAYETTKHGWVVWICTVQKFRAFAPAPKFRAFGAQARDSGKISRICLVHANMTCLPRALRAHLDRYRLLTVALHTGGYTTLNVIQAHRADSSTQSRASEGGHFCTEREDLKPKDLKPTFPAATQTFYACNGRFRAISRI